MANVGKLFSSFDTPIVVSPQQQRLVSENAEKLRRFLEDTDGRVPPKTSTAFGRAFASGTATSKTKHHDERSSHTEFPHPSFEIARALSPKSPNRLKKELGHIAVQAEAAPWLSPVPVSQVRCVLISSGEMSLAMGNAFRPDTRGTYPDRRIKTSRAIQSGVTQLIDDNRRNYMDHRDAVLYAEDFGHSLPKAGKVLQHMVSLDSDFWLPLSAQVGAQDAIGTRGIGFELVDEDGVLRNERQALIAGMCTHFKFNPDQFDPDWTPQVLLAEADSSSARSAHSGFALANIGIALPLMAPRAYPVA